MSHRGTFVLFLASLIAYSSSAQLNPRRTVTPRPPVDVLRSTSAPGDQTLGGLFPETARALPLSSFPISAPDWPANARYNFETCQSVADTLTPDSVRIYGRDLDSFRNTVTFVPPPRFCAPEECFLRVNSAHVGRVVTITENGVACEDPNVPGLGQCNIGYRSSALSGVNDFHGYRGNVIIADRIRVSGRIQLGTLSLVLVAREQIEFLPGSEIFAGQGFAPAQATYPAAARVCVADSPVSPTSKPV